MIGLKIGVNYLLMTKHGQIYFGKFVNCERTSYCSSKRAAYTTSKKRLVDIFEDVYFKSIQGNESHYNYLHLLTGNLRNAVEVSFTKSKFLNMPKTELMECFENAIREI